MKSSKVNGYPRKDIHKKVTSFFFIACLSLLTGCSSNQKAGMIVAGSTSVQPFAEALSEEFMHKNPEIVIDIIGGGSSAGIMSAQTQTAAIGMSSRNLKDDEKTLWSVVIALDGLAVIVHPENPISDLSLDQVRQIYSGEINNWSQLGGKDRTIHVITREEGSGTRSAFEDLVMEDTEIDPRSIVQDSNGTVRQLSGEDPDAIGYISLGLVNQNVKALRLDHVAATHENVINGTYNLSRPFIFVSDGEPTGDAKRFIDYVLSDEGKALLNLEGLVAYDNGSAK